MRPLILTDAERAEIARVIAYAEAERYSFAELQRIAHCGVPIGDDPRHTCVIPVGFRCCFSIEEQPKPLGWCRHLSVSVDAPGRAPNIFAINMLMEEFGFRKGYDPEFSYVEQERAINVIEPMEEIPRGRD